MTGPQRRALEALVALSAQPHGTSGRPWGHTTPAAVARALWPDSVGWTKRSSRGSTPAGGAMGATMPMKAATLLWRLEAQGLASKGPRNQWFPTTAGHRALEVTP